MSKLQEPAESRLRARLAAPRTKKMPRIRLIHWNQSEASELRDALRAGGHVVEYDEKLSSDVFRTISESPPDAFVIDLSRLPSQGREVAIFLRGRKATRSVALVFVGGDPEKTEAIRKLLPDAYYAPVARVRSAVREALAHRPADPVVPAQMMDRYAAKTTAQKLGICAGLRVALIDPPRNYAAVIGELPPGASLEESPSEPCAITLWFVHDAAACAAALPAMRKLAARTRLWIVWRKGSDVTQPWLRQSAAAVGLVDYKICSVTTTWSAMLFARRKTPTV